jgi:hypothetical protein
VYRRKVSASTRLYSAECVEGMFSEVRETVFSEVGRVYKGMERAPWAKCTISCTYKSIGISSLRPILFPSVDRKTCV